MTTQLTKYDAARNALLVASTVDEVKDIRDKSEAMAAYARQAKDTELLKWATEIKVRAERRAGQMLSEMPKATGAKGNPGGQGASVVRSHDGTAQTPTLSDIGVTKNESSRWQKLAAVSDEQFESAVAAAKDVAGEVTTAAMMRAAKPAEDPKPAKETTPKQPKPATVTEDRAAEIIAENEALRAANSELAKNAGEAIAENDSMGAIFDADDRLAAAMKEIDRQKAEIRSLRESLNGKMNECAELNRLLKSCIRKREALEKAAAK